MHDNNFIIQLTLCRTGIVLYGMAQGPATLC